MTELNDHQLLARFCADHDRTALNELARRYIGLVYSAAKRQVGDPHLAEDITQAVFIVLVRNARTIRHDAVLSAWLFTVTRHAASNALRVRSRQRFHEMRKTLMSREESPADSSIDDIRPHLDEAIARLPLVERSGVLLHYFEQRTHKQVGQALGLTEEAARKRVNRAIEKIRTMLQGRGVTTASVTLVTSALAFEATATAAPPALLASTVNIAVLANSIGVATPAAMIAQGVIRMIAISKLKFAAAACVAFILVGGAVSPVLTLARRAVTPMLVTTLTTTVAPASQPSFVVDANEKMKVEFLGVSKYPPDNDTWWAINGEPIDAPDNRLTEGHVRAIPEPENMIAVKVTNPPPHGLRMRVKGATSNAVMQMSDNNETLLCCAFSSEGGAQKASLEIGISEVDWSTVAANENPKQEFGVEVPAMGLLTFSPIEEAGESCEVSVNYAQPQGQNDAGCDVPNQLIVVGEAGKQHLADNINVNTDGQNVKLTCKFDIAAEKVQNVLFQTRPFTKFVDAGEVSLEKGTITKPTIKVREAKDGK